MMQKNRRKTIGSCFLLGCLLVTSTDYLLSHGHTDDPAIGAGATKPTPLTVVSQEEKKAVLDLVRDGKSKEITTERAEQFVTMLRTQYPYDSLRDRLAYESKSTQPQSVRRLSQVVAADLIDYESKKGRGHRTDGQEVRPSSLELLHKEAVRDFIARDGNGFGRTPPPSVIYLELAGSPPIAFDSIPSAAKNSNSGSSINDDAFSAEFPSPYRNSDGTERRGSIGPHIANDKKMFAKEYPLMVPSRRFFDQMHRSTRDEFVAPSRSGHIQSIDQVSGFVPHRLDRRPQIEPWDHRSSILFREIQLEKPGVGLRGNLKIGEADLNALREVNRTAPTDAVWLLRSLELVSLLKHDTPVAYLSSHLPDMEKLAHVETRPLQPFEIESLSRLKSDEDLVIAARTNEIRLLGSIRASASCLKCHEVGVGELLGAFSYHLTRAEPMRDRPLAPLGQQVERKP